MRALIVVESVFGNTKAVGEAVAAGLAPAVSAEVVGVDTPLRLEGIDLVVVGAPTYAHGLSRPASRKSARGQAGIHPVNVEFGLREFIASVGRGEGRPAAAFDTRFAKPRWLTGSAASGAAKRLRHAGFRMAVAPESFFVEATRGPLADGEIARARAWGEYLASKLVASVEHGKAA